MYVLHNRIKDLIYAPYAPSKGNGLGLVDLIGLNTDVTSPLMIMPLADAVAGANSNIIHARANEKIIYLASYEECISLPLIHLNTLTFNFFGNKKQYHGYRQIGDSFMALRKDGILMSWEMATGKRSVRFELPNGHEFDGYKVWDNKNEDAHVREKGVY